MMKTLHFNSKSNKVLKQKQHAHVPMMWFNSNLKNIDSFTKSTVIIKSEVNSIEILYSMVMKQFYKNWNINNIH